MRYNTPPEITAAAVTKSTLPLPALVVSGFFAGAFLTAGAVCTGLSDLAGRGAAVMVVPALVALLRFAQSDDGSHA